MDTILKIPMRQVLDKVPIDQESKAVLLGATGPLQAFYQLILAQESGDWRVASALTAQLHLSEADIADAYWQASGRGKWVRGTTGAGALYQSEGLFGGLELHIFVDRKLRGRAGGIFPGTSSDYAKPAGTGLDLIGIRRTLPGNCDVFARD